MKNKSVIFLCINIFFTISAAAMDETYDSLHESLVISYIFDQKSSQSEIYISVDIEADGPTPLDGNMISLAAVATDVDLNILGFFEANLKPHIEPNPVVLKEFWSKYPKEYERTKVKAVDPSQGMKAFVEWMTLVGKGYSISMMGLPIAYDKMFIQPYAVKFGGKQRGALDGVGGIDVESLIMLYRKQLSYRNIDHTTDVPEVRQSGLSRPHNAIADALDQMVIGVNILRFFQGLQPKYIEENIVEKIFGVSQDHFGKL